MKKFLLMTLFLIMSIMLFESNVFAQVGILYKSEIQSTELDGNDTDTLTFKFTGRVDSDAVISLWILVDYTDGAADSITVQHRTSLLSGSLPNSQSAALVTVVADTAFSDNVWNGYNITPVPGITEFIDILVGHAMISGGPDSSSVQVRLLYR